MRRYDAAVIGGGVAGSSMAAALAGMGWSTVLIDQDTYPRHKVCGEFLSPESLDSLSVLGLLPLLQPLQPSAMRTVRLTAANEWSLDIPLPGTALGISRFALDHALQHAAQERGAELISGTAVISIGSRNGEGHRLELRGRSVRQIVEARAVIGAWGRRPRTGLAPAASVLHQSYVGVKAHYSGMELGDRVELYLFPGGYLGIAPIEGNRHNVAALMTREAFYHAGKSVQNAIEWAAERNPALQRRLVGGMPLAETRAAVYPIAISRKPTAWGQVPLIGDAAVMIPPLCGDGMAVALRTVVLCSRWADEFLRGSLGLDEWRQQYTRALRQECMPPLRWGRWLQRMLGSRVASPLLFRLGYRLPGLAGRMVERTRITCVNPRER